MKELCADLLAEYSELATLADGLTAEEWDLVTPFDGWTVHDEVAHLAFFDEAGLLAVRDAEAFGRHAAAIGEQMAKGARISAVARRHFGERPGPALLAPWRARFTELVGALAALAPKDRLPWYGPPMGARSFATARLMETWAHGQDVWDALRRRRPATERLRHVAHIGVTTFGWSFANRGLPVPAAAPRVELRSPSGETWTWNERSEAGWLRGTAEEFCLVVTQRRHPADTGLQASGESTRRWLAIAQCFAGPPAEGPPPRARLVEG